MKKTNLIFDLGFHNGDDSDFYLKKGFKVVALEANPELVKDGIKRFRNHIHRKNLILINKAVSANVGVRKFYIHLHKSDWGSCDKKLAESDGSRAKVVFVRSVMLGNLCGEFGTPHYLKVDIEGCDVLVAEQLYGLEVKPQYVSFETSKRDYAGIFSWLYASGYRKFQLINQLNNPQRDCSAARKTGEGRNIDYKFSKYSSGFFGRDLPKDGWLSFGEALARYLKYKELKILDNQELALGWLDIHASL